MARKDAYKKLTDKLIAIIENSDDLAWQKGWEISGYNAPQNATTGTVYKGANSLLLSIARHVESYTTPYFVTYASAKDLPSLSDEKPHVKKGAVGYPVIYFNFIEKYDEDEIEDESEQEYIPLARNYTVFNLDDIEHVDLSKFENDEKPALVDNGNNDEITSAGDAIVAMYADCPEIKHGGNSAYYVPSKDFVGMPHREQFSTLNEYYGTLFHELAHSTGAKHRIDRDLKGYFGTQQYAREELVAELSSIILLSEANIAPNFENSAAYIAGWASKAKRMSKAQWIKALKDDKYLIVWSAKRAQEAAQYIMGIADTDESE